jgi:hypothetical protein
MKGKPKLTNKQRTALGFKRYDNGEIAHQAEKVAYSKNNDNVRPDSL